MWDTVAMTAIRTARARARAELSEEIKASARAQLSEVGAAQLSLRAVARDLGMASSALYRYFPSRDDLLTALIVDAYSALAAAVAHAEGRVGRTRYRRRWRVACQAMRAWATDHRSEYTLIFGTPVPGYQAPAATIEPFTRLVMCFIGVVRDAAAAGALAPGSWPDSAPKSLQRQLGRLAAELAPEVPAPALAGTIFGFSQLVGAINLELFGHFAGSIEPADAFIDHSVDRVASLIGLPQT